MLFAIAQQISGTADLRSTSTLIPNCLLTRLGLDLSRSYWPRQPHVLKILAASSSPSLFVPPISAMPTQEEEQLLLLLDSFPFLDDEWLPSAHVEPLPRRTMPSEATIDLDDVDLSADSTEDRRLRRKISNRESARRSRDRKRRRLEELRSEAGRLWRANQDLAARLEGARRRSLLFQRDNERLRRESGALRRRLAVVLGVVMWF